MLMLFFSLLEEPPVALVVLVLGLFFFFDWFVFRALLPRVLDITDFSDEELAQKALQEEDFVILTVWTEG